MTLTERETITRELTPPFSIHQPPSPGSLICCSPHSGATYPAAFLSASQLAPAALRKSEDCYVNELFAAAPACGATLIEAHFPRAYLDVNREPYELDPELFSEPLPEFANTRTMRVIGGLGTIARIVADREEIYAAPIALSAALERIERLYKPFHSALGELLTTSVSTHGFAVLVDCHSMPSGEPSSPSRRPDFVIGDRFGSSCDPRLTKWLRQAFTQRGFSVQLNRPYAGGYITEHYGRPFQSRHAIQIEINRGLYMNEATLTRRPEFGALCGQIGEILSELTAFIEDVLTVRMAAE